MKRASFLLETARLDRELTIEEISKRTKIPARYLQAFELEKNCDFPDEPYCSLMLREYADFLGLNPDELVSVFRRDHIKKANSTKVSNSFLSITPQFTYYIGIFILFILFAGYLIFEYVKFNRPPQLSVNWPVYAKVVEISGITDSESTVKVNESLVVVDQNGNFFKKLELSTSEAKIVVQSTSPAGKTTVTEKILK